MGKQRVWVLVVLFICMAHAYAADNTTKRFRADVMIQEGSHSDYNLRIETAKPVIYIEPGKENHFKLYLTKNPEGISIHDVRVEILNEGFDTRIANPFIEEFKNEELHIMDVYMTPHEGLAEGDHEFNITVSGREFLPDSYEMESIIRVGRQSSVPAVITLLLIIFLVGYVIIMSYIRRESQEKAIGDYCNARFWIKASRFSAWASTFLLIVFYFTGYVMTERLKVWDSIQASTLHTYLCVPAFIFLAIHIGVQGYFSFRRWGWIKRRGVKS